MLKLILPSSYYLGARLDDTSREGDADRANGQMKKELKVVLGERQESI